MIPNPRPGRENSQAKQEIRDQNKSNNNQEQILKPQPSTSNSSRQWTSAFRNPRIVRVSRSFGGKDRHSKVCTVRGLRDRRIRLSVPTAVQLYDLQDRLGLNQPSKVVDWLLEAAKEDVDKLPPLQFPQGFGRLYPNMMFGGHDLHQSWDNGSNLFDVNQSSNRQGLEIGGSSLRTRSYKELEKDGFGLEKGKWVKEGDDDEGNFSLGQSSKDKFYPALINNPTMAFNPYQHHINPSDLSLSQLGNNTYIPHSEVSINTNTPNPTMNNLLPSGSSQLFFCPPSSSTMVASMFPSYPPFVTAQLGDGDENVRQLNQYFQLSNSSNMRSFHQLMNVNPGFGDMQRNKDNRDDENNNNSDS